MVFDSDPLIGTGMPPSVTKAKCRMKVHFRKILSVTWSFEPMTLKTSSMSRGTGNE